MLALGLRLGRIRVIVEGATNIPDSPGIIVASNHLSIADPALISLTIQRLVRRRVRYMAKGEAFDWPLVGPLMTAYGGFGVRRGRPDREAYRMARAVLASGDWLGLAPEGTRSRTGTLGEPKAGVALLAVRTGAPILPVGISGTERLWRVGARYPRLGTTVTIAFGGSLTPSGTGRNEIAGITDDLMRRIAALLPQGYRGRWS